MSVLSFDNATAAEIFVRFIRKSACLAPRLLDESHLPPDGPHNSFDYTFYYDPIYFPLENASCFDTPENFCSWLKKTLRTHSVSCVQCTVEFVGSVSFDGCRITLFFAPARWSLVKTPAYFADANYTHCHLLREFVDEPHRDFANDMPKAPLLDRRQDLLPWVFYANSVYEVNLTSLPANVLANSLSSLPIAKGRTKKNNVTGLVSHFLHTCMSLATLHFDDLLRRCDSSAPLPDTCVQDRLSLVASYLEHLHIWT